MKKSELKQIIKEELYKVFNEIKIERPKKIWDFTKYNPKFNPADIKIGDTIKTKKHSFIVSDIEKGDEDGYTDVNGSVYWYVFEKFDNPLSGAFFSYSSTQLEKFNNSNINEIKINYPSPFEILRRNLIKLIEFDRDNYGYDDSEKEHAEEVIEDLKNATNEKELRYAVNDWVFGDKETTQYYFDLATYKEKFNNPLLNT